MSEADTKRNYRFERYGDEIYLAVSQGTDGEGAGVDDLLNECKLRKLDVSQENIMSIFDLATGNSVLLCMAHERMDLGPLVKINMSKDFMEAEACVYQGLDPEKARVTRQDMDAQIKANMIQHGILEEAVESLVSSEVHFRKGVIARGTPRTDGQDARAEFHFNPHGLEIRPVELENGNVDFYNLNLIQTVDENTLLIEKTPAVEGQAGINIRGTALPPAKVRDLKLTAGSNTKLSEDGNKLYAAVPGHVVFKDGKTQVLPIFEVKEDVGFGTGNIRFPGNVVIHGNVLETFSVVADGDVEIKGILSGYVEAGGNLKVGKGIVRGKTKTKGNIYVHHVENGKVEVQGSLMASEAVLYSTVAAKGSVFVGGKRGLISGGSVSAYMSVNAKVIGSPLATATEIILGITKEELLEYQTLTKQLVEIQETDQKIHKLLDVFVMMKAQISKPLPPDKEEQHQRLTASDQENKTKLRTCQRRKAEIEEHMNNLDQVSLNVSDTLYAGVSLSIGSNTMVTKDEIPRCTYRYIDREIVQQIYSAQAAKRG
jgi:uncharacterized protein (DUF342 family)